MILPMSRSYELGILNVRDNTEVAWVSFINITKGEEGAIADHTNVKLMIASLSHDGWLLVRSPATGVTLGQYWFQREAPMFPTPLITEAMIDNAIQDWQDRGPEPPKTGQALSSPSFEEFSRRVGEVIAISQRTDISYEARWHLAYTVISKP